MITKTKIWLSSPHMGGTEEQYVKEAFDTNWVAPLGPNVTAFEKSIEQYIGNNTYAAALSSGTAAIHLALEILGVGRGDEVICQSFTFSASANPIMYVGANPIFIDSERDTWNISPELLEKAIKNRLAKGRKPKAIIAVHLYGMPYKADKINAISKKYEIPVIEDSAEALGSTYKSKKCGSLGTISILSFNGNKIITTSGGGALLTKDPSKKQRAIFLATQARDNAPHYQHSSVGYNYRLSNVLAGIGRGQMEVLEDRVEARRANFEYYRESLSSIEGISFQKELQDFYANRWLSCILTSSFATREKIRLALEKYDIESRPLWKPMHLQPIFKDASHFTDGTSEKLFNVGLCLPSGSNLGKEDLEMVTHLIKKALMIRKYIAKHLIKYASKWVVLAIDVIIVGVAFLLSYIIRFNLSFNFEVEWLLFQLPMIMVISTIAFLITGSYKGVVRHTGVKDVYNLFNAICLSSIITISFLILNKELTIFDGFTIPLAIIIYHSLIAFMILIASRYIFKSMYYSLSTKRGVFKNIIIYGAGESGILTYNALSGQLKNNVNVIGYIDHSKQKIGKQINGVRVYSKEILTEDFIIQQDISEIIFSIQNIDSRSLRSLVEELVDLPVQVKIVPPIQDWINGELKISQIKKVQIEDLLERTPIQLKNPHIGKELKGKTIVVTGGAGSIGSELVRQIAAYNYRSLIIIDQAESALYDLQQELKQDGKHNFIPLVGDIRDKNRMNAIFQEYKPDIVFHAAAYKHVPLMEYNAYEAIKINVAGTKAIADLSVQHGVDKFILVSTDKAVNPTNVMGATKRIAEIYIGCKQQEEKTKFITTRFGNVLGSNGSVIPLFRKQIEKGGPLTVTHEDVTRYFMTIPEASQLVLEAAIMGEGGEIFIFDMGESVKILDLAKNMIKLSGLQYPEDIDIKVTGLRPGEKLFEELLANGENTLPTHHKKIMISKARDFDVHALRTKIDELCVTNMFFNGNTIVLMKEIVPEYVSNNSELSKFDRKKKKSHKVATIKDIV